MPNTTSGTATFDKTFAIDDIIEATVNPVHIDSRSPFTMTFPQGALIQGIRLSGLSINRVFGAPLYAAKKKPTATREPT